MKMLIEFKENAAGNVEFTVVAQKGEFPKLEKEYIDATTQVLRQLVPQIGKALLGAKESIDLTDSKHQN